MNGSPQTFWTQIELLCIWLILLVAIFAPLEYLFEVHPKRFFRREFFTDLCYYFVNNLVPTILLGIPLSGLAWVVHRLIPAGFLQTMASLPLWAHVAIGFVGAEVGYYWGHRLSHEIPILWRFHAVHHSAEQMDFLVNSRAHPIDMAWGKFWAFIPMYLLGVGGPSVNGGTTTALVVAILGTVWSFFVHANLRWRFGPLEWLVATPHFHHWHHTKSGPINRNYASNLPLIDWMFGSLLLPREWPEDYGIDSKMPDTLVDQLIHPFMRVPRQPAEPKTPVAATPASPSTNLTTDC